MRNHADWRSSRGRASSWPLPCSRVCHFATNGHAESATNAIPPSAAAASVYQQAFSALPDSSVALRLAFALLRAGQPESALPIAESLQSAQPANPDVLLILGLAERALNQPEAHDGLARVVASAPDHPAAEEVRRLLHDE